MAVIQDFLGCGICYILYIFYFVFRYPSIRYFCENVFLPEFKIPRQQHKKIHNFLR